MSAFKRKEEPLFERWNGRAATAALVTPVTGAGTVDIARLCAHARNLLTRGLDAVVPFGTTGEGASLTLGEKAAVVHALISAGVPADRIILGIMATSIGDAVAAAEQGLGSGCAAVLLPPPYYFHGVGQAGVVRWYTDVIERLGDKARDVILYHIPSVTGVAVAPASVAELFRRFGKVIAAVKDSSGDPATTEAFLALGSVPVLVGHEGHLAAMIRKGAVGTISGLANIVPERIARVVRTGDEDPAFAPAVDAVLAFPVVPAVRAVLAHATADASWAEPLPPLEKLSTRDAAGLVARWNALMT
jgi:4-hydroxy-tetrahydrodipicolinate synthase